MPKAGTSKNADPRRTATAPPTSEPMAAKISTDKITSDTSLSLMLVRSSRPGKLVSTERLHQALHRERDGRPRASASENSVDHQYLRGWQVGSL